MSEGLSPAKTAMAQAFAQAGYQSPAKRLMREAIKEGGGLESQVLAIFARELPKTPEAALIREIVGEEIFRSRVYHLFRDTYNEIRREQASGKNAVSGKAKELVSLGQRQIAATETAPKAVSTNAHDALLRGQVIRANAGAAPHPGTGASSRLPSGQMKVAPVSGPPQKPSRVRYGAVDAIARESLLRKVEINGRPLAEITAGEARTWLRSSHRDCCFVRLLVGPMQDEMRFIDWYQDEGEVKRIWQKAQEMADAI
jgi:hypothetical protein